MSRPCRCSTPYSASSLLLIGAIVLFTVSNTMNTAVVERTVEIGTLRAIGLRRAGIRRLFVTEGALLGVVRGCAGRGAGPARCPVLVNQMGIDLVAAGQR